LVTYFHFAEISSVIRRKTMESVKDFFKIACKTPVKGVNYRIS